MSDIIALKMCTFPDLGFRVAPSLYQQPNRLKKFLSTHAANQLPLPDRGIIDNSCHHSLVNAEQDA
nr:hypothetical protein [Halomonas sp.]|tara:strand:+ start:65 stop:262 length:198 start_codon:yes stop_codon:yes gene_type:complete